MPKRSYKGDKRRREIAKKKKREEKLSRKQGAKPGLGGEGEGEDNSYLEYLYPGGLPEELQDDADESDESEDSADADARDK
jgi:hypothetical protein